MNKKQKNKLKLGFGGAGLVIAASLLTIGGIRLFKQTANKDAMVLNKLYEVKIDDTYFKEAVRSTKSVSVDSATKKWEILTYTLATTKTEDGKDNNLCFVIENCDNEDIQYFQKNRELNFEGFHITTNDENIKLVEINAHAGDETFKVPLAVQDSVIADSNGDASGYNGYLDHYLNGATIDSFTFYGNK